MAKPGFYNDNEGRGYPLVKCPPQLRRVSDDTLFELPENTLVDFGALMGIDSGYIEALHHVFLKQICRIDDVFYFEFRSDAPGTFGRSLVFMRPVLSERWLTEDVDDTESGVPCDVPSLSSESSAASDAPIEGANFDFNPEDNNDGFVDAENITSFTESGTGSLVGAISSDNIRFFENKVNGLSAVNFFGNDVGTGGPRRLDFPSFAMWDPAEGLTMFIVYRLVPDPPQVGNNEDFFSDAGVFGFGNPGSFFPPPFLSKAIEYRITSNQGPPADLNLTNRNVAQTIIGGATVDRPPENEWVVEAITWFPGGRMKWYRDGLLIADEPAAAAMPTVGDFHVGRPRDQFVTVNAETLQLEIGRLTTWDRKFSDEELTTKTDEFLTLYGVAAATAPAVSASSDSSDASSTSSDLSETSFDCPEPAIWDGYLVTGPMLDLAEQMDNDDSWLADDDAIRVEPALIRSLINAYVKTLNLANQDRTRAENAEICPDLVYPYPTGGLITNAQCIIGPIQIRPGYNTTIFQSATENSLTIGADQSSGEGEPCEIVPLFDGEAPPEGRSTLDGGFLCNEVIRSINGVGGKNLSVLANKGVSIEFLPDEHRIVIDVDMSNLEACFSDDPTAEQSAESC